MPEVQQHLLALGASVELYATKSADDLARAAAEASRDSGVDRVVICGAISSPASASFADKLLRIHTSLAALIAESRPDCVAIENLFHAVNVRSALKLGRPASFSRIHSRAKLPSWIWSSTPRIFSFTCLSMTTGPRV